MNPATTINLSSLKVCQAKRRPPRPAKVAASAVKLRRDAVRGDDLVGGAAGDFGHAVELPREATGTGGG
jgi:hypothetical protein